MGFRFQKRVKVMPGVRLNISKRGVSASVGRRGASVTLGKTGVYGNVGIPGSGLSYRTKLNKQHRTTPTQHNTELPSSISLAFDKETHTLLFIDEHDQPVSQTVERKIKNSLKEEIQLLYKQKESEINEQTTRLLQLHKQIIPLKSNKELQELALKGLSFDLQLPNRKDIFEEIKAEKEHDLPFLEKLQLIFPTKRKLLLKRINQDTEIQYDLELEQYNERKADFEEEKKQRLTLVTKVIEGDLVEMENWLEEFLEELDFPLETNVSFSLLSEKEIYLDVDLPQLEDIPLQKATILKSGKLKVEEKSQRETREHYAVMVGGTALYLCSFVFSLLPTCETVIISGYTQVRNEATGHLDDQYIYSLKVRKDIFYSLYIPEVHPIAAFENFEPIMNATKTFIFKEIEPYQPH